MKKYFFTISYLLLIFLTVAVFTYTRFYSLTMLERIKSRKHLDVIILNEPTVYDKDLEEHKGFEYELLNAYAQSIGVELNLTVVHTLKEALDLSSRGVGDLTSASLSITPERLKKYKFGPSYYTVYEELICHNKLYKSKKIPRALNDMVGLNIMVSEKSSFQDSLERIKRKLPKFDFNTTEEFSTIELLAKVEAQEIDCTVADSHVFMLSQRYYPELISTLRLSEQINLGWILRKGDDSLSESLFHWLNAYERSGEMAELTSYYYDYLKIFDYVDTKVAHKRIKTILPKYEEYFKEAGAIYNIPWMILAAQSYQESHWNPKAKSYTGVRGMMMLTRVTAKEMGVKDRLNVRESILGGAKYLSQLRDNFSDTLEGTNLLAFSLASYNIGLGHIYDAQELAKKLNKNPNSWNDLKEILPLLSQKKYYKNLKHGKARGSEPVYYVDAIRQYYDLIVQSRIVSESKKRE